MMLQSLAMFRVSEKVAGAAVFLMIAAIAFAILVRINEAEWFVSFKIWLRNKIKSWFTSAT